MERRMTPVEKLEAAIAKLKAERAVSTAGDLVISGWHSGTAIPGAWQAWDSGIGPKPEGSYSPILSSPENLNLTITLHRTIDALLEILRQAVAEQALYDDAGPEFFPEGAGVDRELALASAILGDLE